ncbi:hypothetical protein, partial [Pseudonocardia acaciae]|uniref:hypothetical protein n=1 Tax=Pseudonocardia acaciae TaxID=551276 RepID=UPI00048AE752
AYDQQAAAYNTQRRQVDELTARLHDTTGHNSTDWANPGRDGAGAACSADGAFGQCSTTSIDPTNGRSTQDQSLCLIGISTCASNSTTADRAASATCEYSAGCATTSTAAKTNAATTCGTGDCTTTTRADTRGANTFCQARGGCTEFGKTPTTPDEQDLAAGKTEGLSQSHGTCTKDCALTGFATRADAGADCQTRNGACDTDSIGRRATDPKPGASPVSKDNGEAVSTAHCQAGTIGCDTTTTVKAAVEGKPAAEASARCSRGATDCSGNAATTTNGKTEDATTTPEKPAIAADPTTAQAAVPATPAKTNTDNRTRTGSAICQVTGGACTSSTGPGTDDGVLAHGRLDCDHAKGCSGKASTATAASITAGQDGKTATRATDAHHDCTLAGESGDCAIDASSTVANNAPRNDADTRLAAATTAEGLTASSKTIGTVNCGSADCKGTENGATSGTASGDVPQRASKSTTGCEVHGTNGTCGSTANTKVAYRQAQTGPDGKPQPAGVASVSHADAQVRCENSAECGGKAHTETSALDTAVSKDWRGAATDA